MAGKLINEKTKSFKNVKRVHLFMQSNVSIECYILLQYYKDYVELHGLYKGI